MQKNAIWLMGMIFLFREVSMFYKACGFVLIVIVGGLGWMAWSGQQETSRPDDHGASLIAACREAIDTCDTDSFLALIYTGDSQEAQDLSAHRKMLEAECRRPIQSITIEPLKPTDITSYEMKGVHYRPTLPPAGNLVIRFASEPGAAVHDEETTFLVGRTEGHWWILTAEPDR